MNTDKIRKAWNEAYKPLVADMSDTLTLEEICCIFFELGWNAALERNSIIQWQTGVPKGDGLYIVRRRNLSGNGEFVSVLERQGYFWTNATMCRIKHDDVVAWCKLSDIKPYKEEQV